MTFGLVTKHCVFHFRNSPPPHLMLGPHTAAEGEGEVQQVGGGRATEELGGRTLALNRAFRTHRRNLFIVPELIVELPSFWRVRTVGTRNGFSSRNCIWRN